MLKCERKTETPGTPRADQVVPKEDDDKADAEEHHKFRSGVGMLLCLLKNSSAELSNPMRELTRCMSGAGPENMKEMHGIIKWVLDHPSVGWKCEPQVEFDDHGETRWKMSGMSDATWGSNKDDGRSVTGCFLHFMGVSMAWKSKAQPLCSLSSSESECIAIGELVKEALFTKQMVEDFGHKVEVPISSHCNNQGPR